MNKETPILIPAYVKTAHKNKVRRQLGFDAKLVLRRVDVDSLPVLRGEHSQLNSSLTHRDELRPRGYVRVEHDKFSHVALQSEGGARHH